jgi:DNA-binding NarL/FixJ family response regulator
MQRAEELTRLRRWWSLRKPTVLLADDHPGLGKAARLLLESAFEIVGTVRDGQALIDAAMTLRPDVVVTDISMPILNGIDAVKQLKMFGSTVPIVFLTVHSDRDFIDACFSAGAAAYVSKHRMTSDLLSAVHEALHGRRFVSPSVRC